MGAAMAETKPFEIISVNDKKVVCEGSSGPLGHPRVYLHIDDETNQIQCPYCSRLFKYKAPQGAH
tara:strand:+ start:326 stop:520 length:195 start_codon:yes stop_codon:yes gene_type:complete